MKKIKLKFSGMGGRFDPENNFIVNILRKNFDVQLSDNPDYLIYSVNSKDYLNYNCVRIFYTAENLVPDFNVCDYGIGFHYLEFGDRYIRFPLDDSIRPTVKAITEFKEKTPQIYVVVGYLKEQFEKLEQEYPGVRLIENPYYDTCNNIASLYVARDHIENAIIMDGDQIIYNSEILSPEFERSGYNSVWTDDETDEWLQTVKGGIVTSCSRTGGKGGWQLYSISRWTEEDGRKLKHFLEVEFDEKQNRQIYWDDVAMFCHPNDFKLGIRPMNASDIIEVDNLSELIALDESYKKYAEEK